MICNSNVFSFTFTLVFNALTSSRTGLIQVLRGWRKQTALCVGSGRCFAIKNEYALKQSKKGDRLTRPNLFSLKGLAWHGYCALKYAVFAECGCNRRDLVRLCMNCCELPPLILLVQLLYCISLQSVTVTDAVTCVTSIRLCITWPGLEDTVRIVVTSQPELNVRNVNLTTSDRIQETCHHCNCDDTGMY